MFLAIIAPDQNQSRFLLTTGLIKKIVVGLYDGILYSKENKQLHRGTWMNLNKYIE